MQAQELEEQIAEQTAEEARLAKMQKKEKDFVEQGASAAAEEPSGPTDNRSVHTAGLEMPPVLVLVQLCLPVRLLQHKQSDIGRSTAV